MYATHQHNGQSYQGRAEDCRHSASQLAAATACQSCDQRTRAWTVTFDDEASFEVCTPCAISAETMGGNLSAATEIPGQMVLA
jgi:hypothetical protein